VEVLAYPINIVRFPITDNKGIVIDFYQNVKYDLCDRLLGVVPTLSLGLGYLVASPPPNDGPIISTCTEELSGGL
jgi:hypothetical protein